MVLRRPSSARGWNSVSAHLDVMLPPRSPSKAALRMRRHRERRRDGLRCMTTELRETEVTALIQKGFLKDNVRNNLREERLLRLPG